MVNFLEHIILYCLSKIGHERSQSSVYHLLNGKKSAQTIQDAYLFSLDPFFQTAPFLTKDTYESIVLSLQRNGYIITDENQFTILTEKGHLQAQSLYDQYPFLTYLQGRQYTNSKQIWERLSLFMQVLSHLVNRNSHYIPIQKNPDAQRWVKATIASLRTKLNSLPKQFLEELTNVLGKMEFLTPEVLVLRFTGFEVIGLTEKQTAFMLNIEETQYLFEFQAALHFLVDQVRRNPAAFPLLLRFTQMESANNRLTLSTQKTYQLWKSGKDLTEISQMRRLKISTIQDHIVEIAICTKEVNIDSFVSVDLQQKIVRAMKQANSRQLRMIRNYVDADYFQIRLTLAKLGDSV